MIDLVSICNGNIGCFAFIKEAWNTCKCQEDLLYVNKGLHKMQDNNIIGDKLYMLWNDCCNRNAQKTLEVMNKCSIDFIIEKINYDQGKGITITDDELASFGEQII